MALTPYPGATNYISTLDDQPNDVGGLTAAQLKALFDKFGTEFIAWFNVTHKNEVDGIAGAGRTTENVKANADAIATHLGDAATQAALGHVKLPENWIAPTLLNGWVNYSDAYEGVGYFKDAFGIVHLRGMIKSGTATAGTILFNLPVGYRPAKILSFASLSAANTPVLLEIYNVDGRVALGNSPNNGYLTLSGISFRV